MNFGLEQVLVFDTEVKFFVNFPSVLNWFPVSLSTGPHRGT